MSSPRTHGRLTNLVCFSVCLFFTSHKSWWAFWSTCWARGVLFSTTHPQDLLGKRAFLLHDFELVVSHFALPVYHSTHTRTQINATYLYIFVVCQTLPNYHRGVAYIFVEGNGVRRNRYNPDLISMVKCERLGEIAMTGQGRSGDKAI